MSFMGGGGARLNGPSPSRRSARLAGDDPVTSTSYDVQPISGGSTYASRITQDTSTGLITLVDTSLFNLYQYQPEGWDVSADDERPTPNGRISVHGDATFILEEKRQISLRLPMFDYAGYVNEGGPANHKARVTSALLRGVSLQVGVKNVFAALPPTDVYYNNDYISPYGDRRLHSYWFTLHKKF